MSYFGCSILHAVATCLALVCSVMGVFCLVSPHWVDQDLARTTNTNFESGHISYGLISMCFLIDAQPRTGNVNYGSCPQFYGKDIGRDWPSKPWAAAVVLMGVSVVFTSVVFVCGVADMCTISSMDIFCSLSVAFAVCCNVLILILFFAGASGVTGIDGVGEIMICPAGARFTLGNGCTLQWTAHIAIASLCCSVFSSLLFGLSGKARSGSGAYA